ncbi:hypothetical protein GCM10007426_29300 [Alloalcanivorax dieselolei]|nr:hypothetical protein [Alloalcanivorax xenomutans]GGJ98327.1 hypothetical protein GCM10007426_29300 [Alloalcanivorax dieselolei]
MNFFMGLVTRRPLSGGLSSVGAIEAMTFEDWIEGWREGWIEEWLAPFHGENMVMMVLAITLYARKKAAERGAVSEMRFILRRQIIRRFGEVPKEIQIKLRAATPEELKYWLDRPYQVKSLGEVFE